MIDAVNMYNCDSGPRIPTSFPSSVCLTYNDRIWIGLDGLGLMMQLYSHDKDKPGDVRFSLVHQLDLIQSDNKELRDRCGRILDGVSKKWIKLSINYTNLNDAQIRTYFFTAIRYPQKRKNKYERINLVLQRGTSIIACQ